MTADAQDTVIEYQSNANVLFSFSEMYTFVSYLRKYLIFHPFRKHNIWLLALNALIPKPWTRFIVIASAIYKPKRCTQNLNKIQKLRFKSKDRLIRLIHVNTSGLVVQICCVFCAVLILNKMLYWKYFSSIIQCCFLQTVYAFGETDHIYSPIFSISL